MILEGIVTTLALDGTLNVAPMGPKVGPDPRRLVLRPYRTSTTYRNLKATGEGVLHVTDDVLLIARAAIGTLPEPESTPASVVRGRVLRTTGRFLEFRVVDLDDRLDRTTITIEVVLEGILAKPFGLNRAKHAVVEAAILATRLAFLPIAEILDDFARLAVAVAKTGGPDERLAFGLLLDHSLGFERRLGGSKPVGLTRDPSLTLRAPSRLHFGLLSWGGPALRQFGGVGLMVERPGLTIRARPADAWSASGPLAGRVLDFARRAASGLVRLGFEVRPVAFEIPEAPPEHAGLGLGTQLGLGVARVVSELSGHPNPTTEELAKLSGRGLRSGIGLHGFALGGLIVDGGRSGPESIPPLLARLEFPHAWSILVVIPSSGLGLHGPDEVQAFAKLPPSPESLTDRLCRLVLLCLLPAVVEGDLPGFGEALEAIQRQVGQGFAPAQGGVFARPELEAIAQAMKAAGLQGVGQSSWGPTLYGFSERPVEARSALLDGLIAEGVIAPGTAFWTRASARGATVET